MQRMLHQFWLWVSGKIWRYRRRLSMESGLEGQMSTHRHEEDESLMEMGSGRFGYFFNLVYFFCLGKSFLILLSQNCFVIIIIIIIFRCSHYRRRCKIRAPCCDEIFDCRHCHNEAKVLPLFDWIINLISAYLNWK